MRNEKYQSVIVLLFVTWFITVAGAQKNFLNESKEDFDQLKNGETFRLQSYGASVTRGNHRQ